MAGFDVNVTVKGLEQLKRGVERVEKNAERDQYRALQAAGNAYRTGIYRALKAAVGSDRAMSGMSKRTVKKLGVAVRKERAGGGTAAVKVKATNAGAFAIIEHGRRGGYTVRPRQGKAVLTPEGPRRSARPGPTRGKEPFDRGRVLAHQAAQDRYRKVAGDLTRRRYLGYG